MLRISAARPSCWFLSQRSLQELRVQFVRVEMVATIVVVVVVGSSEISDCNYF